MSDIENYLSDDGSDSDYDDASSVDSETSSLGNMTKTQPLTIKKTIGEEEEEVGEEVGEEDDVGDDDIEEDIEEEDDDEYENEENEMDDDYENIDKEKKVKSNNTKKPSSTVLEDYMEESGDEDENDDDHEEMEERYLQKFDTEINKNYIMDFHPESFINNYDEIVALTNVVRDDMNNIVDPFHKTIPFLTKYEKTRVLGMRAKQINSGCQTFVKVPEHIIDGYLIAEMELKEKRIPFIMRRPLPNGGFEYWNLKDLEIIN
jgi:DNA-directed RNA polymerase I, II, and III subunit RPABC2